MKVVISTKDIPKSSGGVTYAGGKILEVRLLTSTGCGTLFQYYPDRVEMVKMVNEVAVDTSKSEVVATKIGIAADVNITIEVPDKEWDIPFICQFVEELSRFKDISSSILMFARQAILNQSRVKPLP